MNLKRIILFLSLVSFVPAHAALEKIAEDYQKTKSQLEQTELKQRKVMSSLFSLNRRIKKLVSNKSKLEQEKMGLEANTAYLSERIKELGEQMKEQRSQVRERLSVIYKLGGQGLMRILFSSGSSGQLERNLKILGIIAKKDMDLINRYQDSLKEFSRKKNKLEIRLAHLQKISNQYAENEANLVADMGLKAKILQKIKENQNLTMQKLSRIREKTKNLVKENLQDNALLDNLFEDSFFEQKGKLKAPIQAPIIQSYGLMQDHENEIAIQHKGVFFQSKKGSDVKSVFSGKIAYADDLPGMGKTVIIDHGDHYYTVYGYLSQIFLDVGDPVQAGELLGFSGLDSTREQEGLYFEVRHFSEPNNPMNWIASTSQSANNRSIK